jgi:NMD protein affecting ribosome stability and mRNA decay
LKEICKKKHTAVRAELAEQILENVTLQTDNRKERLSDMTAQPGYKQRPGRFSRHIPATARKKHPAKTYTQCTFHMEYEVTQHSCVTS